MKNRKINILNFVKLFLASGMILSGCQLIDDLTSDEYTYHRIQIDSIYIPDSISASQTLEVNLWGKAGNDSCDSFSHYQVSYVTPELNITVWGKQHYVYRVGCPDVELPEENYKYNVSGLKPPDVNIYIHQPNGFIIGKSVTVY